jgi:hypothetical protein
MFETRETPLISPKAFAGRMVAWLLLTLLLLGVSLVVGVLGYHYIADMSWIDALLNAAMILGGMGEVDALHTPAAKLFAAAYALYSGIFLVVCGGVVPRTRLPPCAASVPCG